MSNSNSGARAPSRLDQRPVFKQRKSVWQCIKQTLLCTDSRHRTRKEDISRPQPLATLQEEEHEEQEEREPPAAPPPSRNTSAAGPHRPRRPSQSGGPSHYDLDRRLRELDARHSATDSSANCNRASHAHRGASLPRSSRQHLRPIVTESPTARIVPEEQKLPPGDTNDSINSSPSLIARGQQRFQQEYAEEHVQQHKHLAKLKEVQRRQAEDPVNEGASMYNEAPTSPRGPGGAYDSPSVSPKDVSSLGLHYQDREQQRFDDMRGIREPDSTPTPPLRTFPAGTYSSPDHEATSSIMRRVEATNEKAIQLGRQRLDEMRGIATPTPPPRTSSTQGFASPPRPRDTFDSPPIASMRRRFEAQRQAEVTGSRQASEAGEKTSAGQLVEPLQTISGNARKFNARRLPGSQSAPRPISEYVPPSQIERSPQPMRDQTQRSR